MSHHFYITTTLPYVNADPHIGFGWEITEADVIARYQRLMGNQVIFNTGTDEHGLKIYQKALEAGQEPQAYTDEYAARFSALRDLLDLSYTHFIRTTEEHHVRAAQAFWRRCRDNDDIYQATSERPLPLAPQSGIRDPHRRKLLLPLFQISICFAGSLPK